MASYVLKACMFLMCRPIHLLIIIVIIPDRWHCGRPINLKCIYCSPTGVATTTYQYVGA